MTIEREEKSWWFGKPKIKDLDEGYKEVIGRTRSEERILVVDDEDQIGIEIYKFTNLKRVPISYTTYQGPIINSYEVQDNITVVNHNLFVWLIKGKRVRFLWREDYV